MAQRFVEAATQQLAPVYDQQIQGLQSQIPAIQQLYQTLTQSLQQGNQMQLDTGVQQINEDASRRGVIRSTLPVDARTSLTAQLGQALTEGLGKLGMQQMGDINQVNTQVGGLQVDKANQIASLSRALEEDDLSREKFAYQKQYDAQQNVYKEKELAIQAAAQRADAAAKAAASKAAIEKGAPKGLVSSIYNAFNQRKGADGYVSPQTYREGIIGWVNSGGTPSSFHETYGGFINPKHPGDYMGNYGG